MSLKGTGDSRLPLGNTASTLNRDEEQEIELDELNVIVTVPAGTAGIRILAKLGDGSGIGSVAAVMGARAVFRGMTDLTASQERYFQDHMDQLGDDALVRPMIIKIPEDAVSVTMLCTVLDDSLNPRTEEVKLGVRDIRRAREAFLKYIPDGDDYDAVYVLTDEGRALAEKQEDSDAW